MSVRRIVGVACAVAGALVILDPRGASGGTGTGSGDKKSDCVAAGTYVCPGSASRTCRDTPCEYCTSGCPAWVFPQKACRESESGTIIGCVAVHCTCGKVLTERFEPCNVTCLICDVWTSYSAPCLGVWQCACASGLSAP